MICDVDKAGLKRWIDDNAFRGIGKTFENIQKEIHEYQKAAAIRDGKNSTYLKLACNATVYNILSK